MCGIVAYIGQRQAYPVILKGLKRLEYRGYDSAGVAILNNGLHVYKKKGKVAELEEMLTGKDMHGNIGIGHTRWATHGEPNDKNAHPHTSGDNKLAIVHNGIIENYGQIKKELIQQGHQFSGETDTEVLIHFIEEIKKQNYCSTEEAVRIALKRVVGAYVIVVLDADNSDTLIAARKGSPLVIGIGKREHFLASDASPIVEYTKEVVYVNDYETAIIKSDELVLKNSSNEIQTPYIQKLDIELAAIEKSGYDHFMLKEIFEQPQTIFDSLRGRLDLKQGSVILGGLREYTSSLQSAQRIMMVACGTSWHAGLVAEYMFEELTRIPVEVEYASEFRYRNPVIHEGDIIIAISQSGETADTLVAMESAKEKGAVI
ncbi:MAG: glutamine--fructose-6-phosphate transaminase (isomerizing), partial [Chitinophagaceae bacterium]